MTSYTETVRLYAVYLEIERSINNRVGFRPEILTVFLGLALAAGVHSLSDRHSKLRHGRNNNECRVTPDYQQAVEINNFSNFLT
jgi:uncharacterized metal-binding protein